MSLFDRILKKKGSSQVQAVRLVNEPTAAFTSFTGDAYSNDIYRGAVDAIARNIGKLKGSHVIRYGDHEKIDGDCRLNRILQVRPNPYMSAYDLLYKLATHYYLYNNAFALLIRSGRNLAGVYPITATNTEMLADEEGNLYCRFTFRSVQHFTFPYSDLIHLRRHFNNNDLLGNDNSALYPALELAQTQNEGIISGIKAGANIRGILKFTQLMGATQLQKAKADFVKDYLSVNNDGGVVATDQQMEYTPIESKPVILSAEQTQEVKAKIYDYLGITENIVNSSYTEDQFSAFYESTIEPFAVALSMEFTAKIFNDREQAFGNSILFESGRLQFSSNSTKVNLIKELLPMGILTVNQALEILNLPAIEDGDRRIQSLNYIDVEHAAEYQLSRTRKEEGKKDGVEEIQA